MSLPRFKKSIGSRILAVLIVSLLIFGLIVPPGFAQMIPNLPAPGTMVQMSPGFTPAIIRGVKLFADNPLQFDFIVDRGDSGLKGDALKSEGEKLIKYFMAALTVPEKELWVNLSPYEDDKIIPQSFGVTDMGRDLLAQDYILKQLTSSLMYPEDALGKKFWDRVYKKANDLYGTTDIPVNTFNKIWIVPDKAVVFEQGDMAFIAESHLNVMLEEDYLALSHQSSAISPLKAETNKFSSQIIKEILIPEIEKEVNEGKNFASLRQIYNSMILATWYKVNLKESLLGKVYVDQNKTKGIDIDDKDSKQKIYEQYLEAFKKGVYNYIKEDVDPATEEVIPRKYFSGGFATKGVDGVELGPRVARGRTSSRAMLSSVGRQNIRLINQRISAPQIAEDAPVVAIRTRWYDLGQGAVLNRIPNNRAMLAPKDLDGRFASHPKMIVERKGEEDFLLTGLFAALGVETVPRAHRASLYLAGEKLEPTQYGRGWWTYSHEGKIIMVQQNVVVNGQMERLIKSVRLLEGLDIAPHLESFGEVADPVSGEKHVYFQINLQILLQSVPLSDITDITEAEKRSVLNVLDAVVDAGPHFAIFRGVKITGIKINRQTGQVILANDVLQNILARGLGIQSPNDMARLIIQEFSNVKEVVQRVARLGNPQAVIPGFERLDFIRAHFERRASRGSPNAAMLTSVFNIANVNVTQVPVTGDILGLTADDFDRISDALESRLIRIQPSDEMRVIDFGPGYTGLPVFKAPFAQGQGDGTRWIVSRTIEPLETSSAAPVMRWREASVTFIKALGTDKNIGSVRTIQMSGNNTTVRQYFLEAEKVSAPMFGIHDSGGNEEEKQAVVRGQMETIHSIFGKYGIQLQPGDVIELVADRDNRVGIVEWGNQREIRIPGMLALGEIPFSTDADRVRIVRPRERPAGGKNPAMMARQPDSRVMSLLSSFGLEATLAKMRLNRQWSAEEVRTFARTRGSYNNIGPFYGDTGKVLTENDVAGAIQFNPNNLTFFQITSSNGGFIMSKRVFQAPPASAAMMSNVQKLPGQEEVGGINFDPALLNLQIKRDGKGVPLPLLQQPITDMKIEGFLPVIINITPLTSLPLLSEAEPSEEKLSSLYSLREFC